MADYTLTVPDDLGGADHAAILVEIDALLAALTPLRERVATLAAAAAEVEALSVKVDDALGRRDGRPWRQPVGAPFGYRKAATVTHGGRLWRSARSSNVWEPGTTDSGWTDEGPIEAEPEPLNAADWIVDESVAVGDLRAYEGIVYLCRQAHTTQAEWEPPNVPALWAAQEGKG